LHITQKYQEPTIVAVFQALNLEPFYQVDSSLVVGNCRSLLPPSHYASTMAISSHS